MDVGISILVRTRNDAAFIERTLNAIASQKGVPPFEVIVCNDASTDGTTEILAARNDIRFVARPAGEYRPGRTLNAMVRAAQGEIVVFNNADAIPLDDRWLATLIAPLLLSIDDGSRGARALPSGATGRAVAPATAADATFAQQVPRPDAVPLVRRDYACAFGDGSVSKNWPRFFSLASSAFRRDWLLENPFDETLLYSEDIELVNRHEIVRRYVAEARVEHSHNYNRREWVRRFYGEGYAEAQIFGDRVPSVWRVAAQAAVAALRDAAAGDGTPALPNALTRRFAQKFAWRRGMLDAAKGLAPRYRSTAATKAGLDVAAAGGGTPALPAKPLKFLFTGVYSHLNGGLERFAVRAAEELRRAGHVVDVVGDVPRKLGYYDRVVMQKVPPRLADLRRLKLRYGERLRFYAHDHSLYCLRRHYYDPKRRPCDRVYSFFPCRLCALVTRPAWMPRALTCDIAGFIREMRDVTTFVQGDYMRGNLLRNGFAPERLVTLAPFWTDNAKEHSTFMPDGVLRILYAGQLVAGKGVAVLLDAVAQLKIPWTLTIVGSGRDEAALKARAASIANGKIVFAGWQKSVAPFFAAADVVVVPSLWNEPFCMVGVEAFACGTPVVAFNRGGIGDWLEDGVTGLFAAGGGTPALPDALTKIADPALLAKFSRAAMARIHERYSTQHFLEVICK